MTRPLRALSKSLFLLLLLTLAIGCAHVAPPPSTLPPVVKETPAAEQGWWYVRFIRDWPEKSTEDPAWYMDLLIANEILAPVLDRHRLNIPLWRFHRRAGHDQYGHSLSLIIYCSPATAEAVYAEIWSTPLLDTLLSAGRVTRVTYDATDKIDRPGIGDVSDHSWSPSIEQAWPHFIMGASQTWIDLVSQKTDDIVAGKPPASLGQYEALYQRVNEAVDNLWRDEGRHAFFHHLNALFGYQPLVIWEKKLMTF
jgi:hypothetical protein